MNFARALIVCRNSSANLACSWSCQVSPNAANLACNRVILFWRSWLNRFSSSAKRRTSAGSMTAFDIALPSLRVNTLRPAGDSSWQAYKQDQGRAAGAAAGACDKVSEAARAIKGETREEGCGRVSWHYHPIESALQDFPRPRTLSLPLNRNPLIPSFSPSGGEGAWRAVEGHSDRFMAPIHVRILEVFPPLAQFRVPHSALRIWRVSLPPSAATKEPSTDRHHR